jgi:hypothetical protein
MRAQNWTAIAIEFLLVVAGVFFGIVAANWNEERLQRRQTAELLEQLDRELGIFVRYIEGVERYYRSAGAYGDRAEAAWNGDPRISDDQFIIAAYQASQINGIGNNTEVWATIFGADHLRDIKDPVLRQNLAVVMSYDYSIIDLDSVSSRYREEVRKIIPSSIQAKIRDRCGDRVIGDARFGYELPSTCNIKFETKETELTASRLRARPELAGELHWHRAAVANQMTQATFIKEAARTVTERIGK